MEAVAESRQLSHQPDHRVDWGAQNFRAKRALLTLAVDEDLDFDGCGIDVVGKRNEITGDERALLRVSGKRQWQVGVEDATLLHDLDCRRYRIDRGANRSGSRVTIERCPQPNAEFIFKAGDHQVIEAEHGWRGDVSGFYQVTETGLVNSLLKLHGPRSQTDFPANVDVALHLAAFQQLELDVVALVQ